MNGCVETLNQWGENSWAFAGPMLWQSSLLIAVVSAFDLLFARRVRASVRYALWMVVLLKLILPPSLALPTGAAWWLWRPQPAVETPVIKNYTVSFGNATIPDTVPQPTAPVVMPPPKLSGEAWMLLAGAAAAAGLLSWLAFRWLRVSNAVRRAATAPAELDGILDEARQLAGLRRRPRLKLIEETQSPAVYGLWRPVILLPQGLVSQFSVRQLRAVLLHEALHLRRGDVWVNCAQTLLQIAYWWHPLLWLANARIRRLREEAVDDAVMLALRDGADAYAPTLLEVAKFAFRRPLASLGLVGILESRSALRQRVERLVDFRPPRRAGITVLSLCGIFAFCAVALPMGQGPAVAGPTVSPAVNPIDPHTPFAVNTRYSDADRQAIYRKLNEIHLKSVSYANQPLNEVMHDLSQRVRKLDPDKKGINFLLSEIPRQIIDPATGSPVRVDAAHPMDPSWISITCSLNDVSLREVLNAICKVSGHPIEYSIEDYGVVFRPKEPNRPQYEVRTFKVGTNIFLANLGKIIGAQISERDVSAVLGRLFEKAGLNLSSPKAIHFNHSGILFVYATSRDIDAIERIVETLHDPLGGDSGWLKSIENRTVSASATGPNDGADDLSPANETGISDQTESGLSQALAVEHKNAHVDVMWQASTQLSQTPHETASSWAEAYDSIHLDQFGPFQHAALSAVIDKLSMKDNNVPFLATSKLLNGSQTFIDLPKLTNVALSDALDAIVKGANQPIRYSVVGRFIVFYPFPQPDDLDDELYDPISGTKIVPSDSATYNPDDSGNLETHVFILENKFVENLQKKLDPQYAGGSFHAHLVPDFKRLLSGQGINLDPPKTMSFKVRRGGFEFLSVHATPQDLVAIGNEVRILNGDHPLIHIKARFIEVPKQFFSSADVQSLYPGMTNGGVLPNPELQLFLHQLRSQEGFDELAEPEVTTIAGRQTQMRATEIQPVITDYVFDDASGAAAIGSVPPSEKFSDGSSIVPKIERVETGPIFDVVLRVLSDGWTLGLQTKAAEIEYFGYASTKGLAPNLATNAAGAEVKLPRSLPVFEVREASMDKLIYDGQTLVLFPKPRTDMSYAWNEKAKERIAQVIQHTNQKKGEKVLIVLATATLIDAAGNRAHTDDEMPFALTSVPEQSP